MWWCARAVLNDEGCATSSFTRALSFLSVTIQQASNSTGAAGPMDNPLLGQVVRSDDVEAGPATGQVFSEPDLGSSSMMPIISYPAPQPQSTPSPQHPTRSSRIGPTDDEEPQVPQLLLIVESLIPVRGHAIEIGTTETIRELKARYAQKLWEEARARNAQSARPGTRRVSIGPGIVMDGITEKEYELRIRLVHDGAELADIARIEECGLNEGSRIVAMDRRQRKGFVPKVLRLLSHWWPMLGLGLLVSASKCHRAPAEGR